MRLLLLLPALILADMAQAAPDGPVARAVLAQQLFDAGVATRDGLTQIAAARVAAGITLHPIAREPKVEGKGKGKVEDTPRPMDAPQMLAAARAAVAADETLGILLTSAEATAEVLPKDSLRVSDGALAAGQSHHFEMAAEGGIALDIGVLTAPGARIALEVVQGDQLLCRAERLCSVTLPESTQVTVTLRNPGEGSAGYRLLTN
jgi:hypothetical protein